MNAGTITKLLATRHSDDVFIPECKGGPTWGGSHDRMDAWAMRKSWSRPCVWAYEIKVSRSDFLRDEKWMRYLAYCNEFYFVCPKDVIRPDELPADAGLIYVTKTGGKLITKKKSPHRSVEIPEELWRYVLMSRVAITEARHEPETKAEATERWKRWLAERAEAKDIGYSVSVAVRKHVAMVDEKNAELKNENAALAYLRDRAIELGADPGSPVSQWQVRSELDKLSEQIQPHHKRQIRDAIYSLQAVADLIDKQQEKKP